MLIAEQNTKWKKKQLYDFDFKLLVAKFLLNVIEA